LDHILCNVVPQLPQERGKMKTNDSANACPKCGATVPPEAPQGLCPQCVFAAAAAPEVAPTATSQIPSLERLAAAFPQLQILELIGRGGMGFVFKARQPHLDRFVALKLLPDSLAHDPQFTERFNREGRTLARLNHPNIVSIFDFGHVGGFYYLLMEYVDGVNLRQAMQAGRFSPAEALTIVPKICEALQYAHEEGILHRDIKPENILLDAKGRVKIADFGIAKIVGDDKPDVSLTATGATLGTPHYMAPEQFEKPATVDHRADIYSLGVVFYELLTGELPIGRFSPPSQRTPLDPRVDEVVMRTLEKEREKRFQSAGEMGTNVEHLTEVGAGARPSAPNPTPITPAEDFILCHPRLPRMAQFITVFALVVTPALWFVGLMTMDTTPHPNLYAEFVQVMTRLVTFWGELLTTVLFFIGGWKLRALKKSGPRLISVAVWINMALIALVIGGLILIENLVRAGEGGDKPMAAGEAMLVALQVGALIFQIITLVWLRRNRAVLKGFFESAATPRSPGRTMVIQPGDVVPTAPKWSWKAIISAVLVGVSLPLPIVLGVLLYLTRSGMGSGEMFAAAAAISLPGLAGTILGWVALNDLRARQNRERGLGLAVFGALALPLFFLVAITLALPLNIAYRLAGPGPLPLAAWLMFVIPAGSITFAVWAVYTAARWGGNQPPSARRGVLKWVFLALMIFAASALVLPRFQSARKDSAAREARLANTPATVAAEAVPSIRFTITAVELREEKGVRWLALDYLDDVRGACEKSFPWENTIPGFTATTRTSEFIGGDTNAPVRHQRVEYRMPDSIRRDQLEQLRDSVARMLARKTFRLEPGGEKLLFEIAALKDGWVFVAPPEGTAAEKPAADTSRNFLGAFKARIKVGPPLREEAASTAIERRIRLAREQLEAVQQRVDAGAAGQQQLAEALRDLEVAEARGDAEKEARAKLKFAEEALQLARKRFEAGVVSAQEMRAAESRQAIAEIELQQALKRKGVTQP
jgi:hypothetical protein